MKSFVNASSFESQARQDPTPAVFRHRLVEAGISSREEVTLRAGGCTLKWCQGFWVLVNLGDSQSCLTLTQRCPRQVRALSTPVSSAGSCRDL